MTPSLKGTVLCYNKVTHGASLKVKKKKMFIGQMLKGFKKITFALAGVVQWIGHRPVNQRVADSIPSQGTGLQTRSPVGDA